MGLGALASLGLLGLLHDLTAMALSYFEAVGAGRSRVHLDAPMYLGIRVFAEMLMILGAATMARGRTAGLLMLLLATPMFVPTVLHWSWPPVWGGGCVSWVHLLGYGARPLLAAALALALLPWLGPLWRQRQVLFARDAGGPREPRAGAKPV